jgi:hypothetical protein
VLVLAVGNHRQWGKYIIRSFITHVGGLVLLTFKPWMLQSSKSVDRQVEESDADKTLVAHLY